MARKGRWTNKQEKDVEKLWDAAVPIILQVMKNPQTAPGKRIDIAMDVIQKFGIVRQEPSTPPATPPAKFIFMLGNGERREVDEGELIRNPRLVSQLDQAGSNGH